MGNNFTEDDVQKLKRFMDLIGKNANMSHNIKEMLETTNLIGFIMKELIPKIDAHILEVKRVVEAQESEESTEDSGEE